MFGRLLLMAGLGTEERECAAGCSGRGECLNGTCYCEIRYAGADCDFPNVPYHAAVGGLFVVVAAVCAVQLVACVASEYRRLKAPTLLRACRVTTQKLLYVVTFLASSIRAGYFLAPENFKFGWSRSLLSAYYPLLMSGSSLLVCFWAEVFHLRDICWERPQFLSKSFLGFISFNIISYSFLLAEVFLTQVATPTHDIDFYAHLFNGCYAVLLFIVVVFFLIYGVEVYFKVRGGFVARPVRIGTVPPENEPLRATVDEVEHHPQINNSQLHQSRVGLLSHALMLIVIVGFLFSETLSEFWKTKVPVYSRNWHDVLFRVVEIGVAVWFPAVLWNCMQPSELWILNPRKLLAKLDQKPVDSSTLPTSDSEHADPNSDECWICYDERPDEPFIRPCACAGDLSSVHHECLRRWLMESRTAASSSSSDRLCCKVCKQPYDVQCSTRLDWEKGFTAQHWGSTAVIVTVLCVTVAAAWIVIQLFENSYVRIVSASIALLIIYVCIKFLGQNTVSAYQRAKIGGVNIGGRVTTISANVTIGVDQPTEADQPQTAI